MKTVVSVVKTAFLRVAPSRFIVGRQCPRTFRYTLTFVPSSSLRCRCILRPIVVHGHIMCFGSRASVRRSYLVHSVNTPTVAYSIFVDCFSLFCTATYASDNTPHRFHVIQNLIILCFFILRIAAIMYIIIILDVIVSVDRSVIVTV
ncbi:unnamed protein product [Aphis gossypii]|uniref:Uncharacterized protein n=1 Tax=Aphis gossypii TaxID=80765 RepID=A0A9P0J502_APHGO|nr:unnamed protein product [Aphis gossypii]